MSEELAKKIWQLFINFEDYLIEQAPGDMKEAVIELFKGDTNVRRM